MSKFENFLIENINKKYKLNDEDQEKTLHMFRKIDLSKFQNVKPDMLLAELTNLIIEKLKREKPQVKKIPNHIIDIHEMQKVQMYEEKKLKYTYYYAALDSDRRDTSSETTTIKKFRWNYAPTQNVRDGFFNTVGEIKNIIGVRLYQPSLPFVNEMKTTSKRVTLLIEEFHAQSYMSRGRSFHYLLRPNLYLGQTTVELSMEDYSDGIYMFHTPFTTLDSLTLSFSDLDNDITFSPGFDRFMIVFEFICLK